MQLVNSFDLKWESAYSTCCSLGMKLLSFDFEFKYEGVAKAFKGKTKNYAQKIISFFLLALF